MCSLYDISNQIKMTFLLKYWYIITWIFPILIAINGFYLSYPNRHFVNLGLIIIQIVITIAILILKYHAQ